LAKVVAQSIALHIGALYKVVDEQGVAHAWAWVVWDEQRAYYLMGARSSEAPHASALTYLLWQMMLLQKSKGKISFDLEGSMDQGVANYYQGFPTQKTMYVAAQKNSHWLWKLRALFQ
jgi:lipid II:glycine glycyltransferase (peptidoglycan interpeptide bridge formation enzyme)